MLDTNLPFLRQSIDPTDVIIRLMSDGAITSVQRDFIDRPNRIPFEKVGDLIEILLRRSFGSLLTFIKCLKETNQGHIARLLEERGGVVINIILV